MRQMKKLKTKKIIGIDYSLTCPAVCVTNGSFDFEDCKFYYTTTKKKYEGQMAKNIIGYPTKPYNDDIESVFKSALEAFKANNTW